MNMLLPFILSVYDDVIKWKHFTHYWPFVRGIHRSPVDSPHKGQSRRALMFPLVFTWTNGCANNRDAGDLRRNRIHFDVTVMIRHGFLHHPALVIETCYTQELYFFSGHRRTPLRFIMTDDNILTVLLEKRHNLFFAIKNIIVYVMYPLNW